MVAKNLHILGIDDIRELAQYRVAPCVSAYTPLCNGIFKTKEGPVRFSNQLKAARKYLEKDFSLDKTEISKLLAPAYALCEDRFFWKTPADGLAAFIAPGMFRKYRLPIRFTSGTTVAGYFDLKPLFPLLTANHHYYLLALTKKKARLFSGSRYGINEIKDANFPEAPEIPPKKDGDRRIESHASGTGQGNIFHGQGGLRDAQDAIAEKFFRAINKEIRKLLMFETAPLLLAAPERLRPIYERVNGYPELIRVGEALAIDPANEKKFAANVWKIARPRLEGRVKEALERYASRRGSQKTSESAAEIIPAAANGRVECLFCAKDARLWGKTDPIFHMPSFSDKKEADEEDLVARAILDTFLQRGYICVLPAEAMPGKATLAATFRF